MSSKSLECIVGRQKQMNSFKRGLANGMPSTVCALKNGDGMLRLC